MGKPSTTSSQKSAKSNHSLRSNSSERKMSAAMSSTKGGNLRKRRWTNKDKKIQKLFKKMRDESRSSLNSSHSNTIISLDDSNTSLKRKLSSPNSTPKLKMRKTEATTNIIIINDDESEVHTPRKDENEIHCSTPVGNKSSNTLKDLNVSNIVSNSKNNSSVELNFNKDVDNLTKEINRDSYLTIDLTAESSFNKTPEVDTVIDLNKVNESPDVVLVSASNTSMSGDSDVTVLNRVTSKQKKERDIRRFANGIANLDASSKGRLLELITQNIFSGCNIPKALKDNLRESRATETVEDTYIKEVILGERQSRNSIGSNIYNPERDAKKTGLRMIVIDGSNVAMEHGKGRVFSVKGLKICIDYFLNRGHSVKAFVPRFRCKFGKSTDPRLLDDLERRGLVVYTPSREVQGKMITSYDDRYIVQCAAEFDGVIVSGDNYRDLMAENPRWRRVIEQRLLPFTWVQDMIMFPRDPLGRNGPTLEAFLRHTPQ